MAIKDGAKGTIWSTGIHQVYVNNKPAKVYVPQHTIPETFDLFNKTITEKGGITLGIDHIPTELLESYPILKKLNPLDVGKITEIASDGERIYATKSEHTNPLIAELFLNDELKAYSIVSNMNASICETGKADYVLEKMKNIDRTDYVDEGGCQSCKVGSVPDDLILTAKLSMEVDTVVEETQENIENPTDETTEEEVEETQEEETQEEEVIEDEPLTIADVKQAIVDTIKEVVPDMISGETAKVEAKLANVTKEAKLEAKTAKVEKVVEAKIMAGFATPAMKDSLVEAGKVLDDEGLTKLMAGLSTKLWEGGSLSETPEEEEPEEEDTTIDQLEKMGYFN